MTSRIPSTLVPAIGPDGELMHYSPTFWEVTQFEWQLASRFERAGIVLRLAFCSPFLALGLIISLFILAMDWLTD